MSFLTLNGIAWPVSVEGLKASIIEIGYKGRSISGSMIGTRRAIKRQWKGKTPPLSPTDAAAFKAMLIGQGQHWSFDAATATQAVYSDKGYLLSGTIPTQPNPPPPKFGANSIQIGSAATLSAYFFDLAGNFASILSYVVWFWNGTAWDGYAGSLINGGSTVTYKNGALLGSPPGFLAYFGGGGAGYFGIGGYSAAGVAQASSFDDLVVLPYLARPADLAAWSTETVPFSALPALTPGGDLMEAPTPAAVYGSVGDVQELSFSDGISFYDNGQVVGFTLDEV